LLLSAPWHRWFKGVAGIIAEVETIVVMVSIS